MFTTELLKNIPALYSQDGKGKEAIVYMHIEALNGWQWFITEYDGKELFFGYVKGFADEWGYIDKNEMEDIINNHLATINTNFKPTALKDVI